MGYIFLCNPFFYTINSYLYRNVRMQKLSNIYNGIYFEALVENAGNINEIDWEGKYADTKASCMPMPEVIDLLNKELIRIGEPTKTRTPKTPKAYFQPLQTKVSQDKFTNDEGTIDIKAYIQAITTKPKILIDQNSKMEKSDKDGTQTTVNTGVPAVHAIVFDTNKKEFYSVNTCPGAGSCILSCYARKGQFGMNDGNILKLLQRVNLLMNDPEEYYHLLMDELEPLALKTKREGRRAGNNKELVIRWNDAGDFFSQTYFDIAKRVTDELIGMGYPVKSYAYTKTARFYDLGHEKFIMNYSTGAKKSQTDTLDLDKIKYSDVVPKDIKDPKTKINTEKVFSDLFQRGKNEKGNATKYDINPDTGLPNFVEGGSEELRRRISKMYNVSMDTLVYQHELPNKEGERYQYNAIVLPTGDSDISAQRNDVRRTFLLFH
jgi:hypothetical protein